MSFKVLFTILLCLTTCLGSNPGSHITFSGHISLVSFNLEQLSGSYFVTLTFVRVQINYFVEHSSVGSV